MNPGHYLILLTFFWVGFICAISFMEAWLKFRAPGVTLPVGLSIGRLVFSALNKVEWFLALICLALLYLELGFTEDIAYLLFVSVLLLLVQTGWLLPAMNKRISQVVAGDKLQPSKLHFYYIGAELIKVVSLVCFGWQLFAYQVV